jgi:hypothetical protein
MRNVAKGATPRRAILLSGGGGGEDVSCFVVRCCDVVDVEAIESSLGLKSRVANV